MIIFAQLFLFLSYTNLKKTKEIIILHSSNNENQLNKYIKTRITIQILLKNNYKSICNAVLQVLTKNEYKIEYVIKMILKKSLDFVAKLFENYDRKKYANVSKIFTDFIQSKHKKAKNRFKCSNK